jgi:hypothetical protein
MANPPPPDSSCQLMPSVMLTCGPACIPARADSNDGELSINRLASIVGNSRTPFMLTPRDQARVPPLSQPRIWGPIMRML